MNGLDVLQQMQASPDLRDIPIIIITGKDLTAAERVGLGDVAIWNKGNLDRRRLLQSVEQAIP